MWLASTDPESAGGFVFGTKRNWVAHSSPALAGVGNFKNPVLRSSLSHSTIFDNQATQKCPGVLPRRQRAELAKRWRKTKHCDECVDPDRTRSEGYQLETRNSKLHCFQDFARILLQPLDKNAIFRQPADFTTPPPGGGRSHHFCVIPIRVRPPSVPEPGE